MLLLNKALFRTAKPPENFAVIALLRMLIIKDSKGRGRGVFSDTPIGKDSIIESCPVLIIPADQRACIDSTIFFDYYFKWKSPENPENAALPLGYGSLYNHSYQPNAFYRCNYEEQTLNFLALRDIAAHEEIFVNYNGDPGSQKPLWKSESIDWIE